MKAPLQQSVWVHAALACLLGIAVLGASIRFLSARSDAESAANDLAECHRLQTQIDSLRQHAPAVSFHEIPTADIARCAESAADKAQIPKQDLVHVWPDSPRRLGDSAYTEQSTQILLRQVTLRQLLVFLDALGGPENALQARAMRLQPPRNQESGKAWNVELTVSQLLYQPGNNPQERTGY